MGFNGRGGQQAFANFLGVDRGRWNNVECGAPLSKDMALRIVRKFLNLNAPTTPATPFWFPSQRAPPCVHRRPKYGGVTSKPGLGVHPRPGAARSLDGDYSTLSGILATLISGRASWLRS